MGAAPRGPRSGPYSEEETGVGPCLTGEVPAVSILDLRALCLFLLLWRTPTRVGHQASTSTPPTSQPDSLDARDARISAQTNQGIDEPQQRSNSSTRCACERSPSSVKDIELAALNTPTGIRATAP